MVAVPKKLVAGLNTTLAPAMLAVPLVGLTPVIVRLSPSGSLSLTSGWMVTATSSTVFVKSLTATGGSWVPVTETVIKALAVPPWLSLMLYPMVAVPKKLVAGVNTTLVPAMLAVPLVGLTLVIVRLSP